MMWTDVVDSAVKIGLGALIAGGFTFLTTRLTHDRGARAEYARRRRDMLERVLATISQLLGFGKPLELVVFRAFCTIAAIKVTYRRRRYIADFHVVD
jgi:hypothetical protein